MKRVMSFAACLTLLSLSLEVSAQLSQAKEYKAKYQGAYDRQPLTGGKAHLSLFLGPLSNPTFGGPIYTGYTLFTAETRTIENGVPTTETEFVSTFALGAAFGVTPNFEVGFLIPKKTPLEGYDSLAAFFTWSTTTGSTDFGLRTTVYVPVGDVTPWRINPGVHTLFRFGYGRADLGVFFPISFSNDTEGFEQDLYFRVEAPLRITFGLTENFFLGVETGLTRAPNFLPDPEYTLFLPLGAHGVLSFPLDEERLDITLSANWPNAVWFDKPDNLDSSAVPNDTFISLGFNVHMNAARKQVEPSTDEDDVPQQRKLDQAPQGRPPAPEDI